MRVPFCEKAEVNIRKLRDYCLNPNHEVGKHKARVFASALNLSEENAEELQTILLDAVKIYDAEIGRLDKYGQHYTVDFEVERQGKRAVVRSGWIIDAGSDVPRLVTCMIV